MPETSPRLLMRQPQPGERSWIVYFGWGFDASAGAPRARPIKTNEIDEARAGLIRASKKSQPRRSARRPPRHTGDGSDWDQIRTVSGVAEPTVNRELGDVLRVRRPSVLAFPGLG